MIGPNTCWNCGADYGEHSDNCSVAQEKFVPRRFRISLNGQKHPNGSNSLYRYGIYFPQTDLVVGDMGGCGTGEPKDVEWIDGNNESRS